MIIDKLKNAKFYYGLGENIKKGLQYLENNDLSEVENGKIKIDGENLFVSIQDYDSKPLSEGRFEAHKKYIDIQYIIKGTEKLGFTNIGNCTPTTAYDEEKDIVFLGGEGDFAVAKEGSFLIFTPEDAHMPGLCVEKQGYIKKAVVKVMV